MALFLLFLMLWSVLGLFHFFDVISETPGCGPQPKTWKRAIIFWLLCGPFAWVMPLFVVALAVVLAPFIGLGFLLTTVSVGVRTGVWKWELKNL